MLRKKILNFRGTSENESTCEAKDFWSNSAPSATHVARPEDSVAFEIRPQGFALQAPASSGSQASFFGGWKPRVFWGPGTSLERSSHDVNVLWGQETWSFLALFFPGRSWHLFFFETRVSFTKAGSRGRKKAQESVGKDEDWVHSGHRLNLPLEARPEIAKLGWRWR